MSSPDVSLSSESPVVLAAPREPPATVVVAAAGVTACGNCGYTLAVADRYCGRCGQRHRQGRLKVIEVAADLFSNFVAVDHGIFYTLATLTHDPGRVVRDYWAGKRRTYISPVTYLVTGAALQVILDAYDATARAVTRNAALRAASTNQSPAQAAAHMKLQRFLWATPGARGVIFAVLMAVVIWALFRWPRRAATDPEASVWQKGINFSEALVASCYLNGHKFLVSSVLATLVGNTAGIEWRYRYFIASELIIPVAFLGGIFGWRPSVLARSAAAALLVYVLWQVWFTVTRALIVLLSGS